MEAKTTPSFFQISINTEKFSQFTNSLNAILASHEKQLQQHTRELAQMRLQVDEKVNRVRGESEYEFDKIDKKLKDQSQHNLTFHSDLTIKYQFLANESRNKASQFQEDVLRLQHQLDNQEAATRQKLIKEIEKEVQILVQQTKLLIEKEIENVSRKIKDMESTTASHDSLVRNIMNAYQNRSPAPGDENKTNQPKTQPVEVLRYASPDKGLSLDQQTVKEGKQRKRRKIQQKCEQENLQYASISAKLELLQNRLTAKENQSLDKVVYAKKQSQCIPSQPSEHSINFSFGKIELERRCLQQKISYKLQSIESIINQNFVRLENELVKVNNNQALFRDEIDIALRKVEKQKNKLADITLQIKRIQERRVDEKLIENMVTMFKRQYRALEDEMEKKISTESFNRQKQRLSERIQVIGESVSEKADKEQIKRAFQFVEDKMKEIVLIIADDVHHQKEGAIKRIPFKCLSCDKDLQSSLPTTLRHNSDKKPLRPPTTQTSQIRKKVRVAHHSKEYEQMQKL